MPQYYISIIIEILICHATNLGDSVAPELRSLYFVFDKNQFKKTKKEEQKMRRKSLKQVVVVLTVVSFLCAATAPSFAASISGNDFNVLGNVPEQEAIHLSDEEMGEVKGEFVVPALAVAILAWVTNDIADTYGQNVADYFSQARMNGATVPQALNAALKNRAYVSDTAAHTLTWSILRAAFLSVNNIAR